MSQASWTPSLARTVAIVPLQPLRGVRPAQPRLAWPSKASAELLDFSLDLSGWMIDAGDSVAEATVTVLPTGGATDLGIFWDTPAGQMVVLAASGGTAGTCYQVSIEVTTAIGRTGFWLVALPVDLRSPSQAPAAATNPPAVTVDGEGHIVMTPAAWPTFDTGISGATWISAGWLMSSGGPTPSAGALDFQFANLPQSDPLIAGRLWSPGGKVVISAGPLPAVTDQDRYFAGLPTADPLVLNAPWSAGGYLTFSAGPAPASS